MGFVFSPSNMATYRDCPRKFQAQSITKELKWKPSKEKARGTAVHESVQQALRDGLDKVALPQDIALDYTRNKILDLQSKADTKHFIEYELVVDSKLQPVTWWDDDAFIRARADMISIPEPVTEPITLIDIKTGKKWDTDSFQLRVEALLAHTIYKRMVINYEYWYVDTGETVGGTIDFAHGTQPIADILSLVNRMKLSIRDNLFVPKKNKFCNWCGLYQTPACGR